MSRRRIAILGLGRISNRHIEAIQAHADRAEIVAACDINPTALLQVAGINGVNVYSDLDTMLKTEQQLDLVSVCTPSGLHPEHGKLIAKQGLNVLVEKPMGVSLASARELVNVCRTEGVRLFIVKQNRYNQTLSALRKAIQQGRFGKIYMLVANVFWTRPQSYYDQAAWRGTWEMDGGAFMNQASHYVDLMQWLGGEVKSVQARIATLARNIEVEDTGVALFEYESGALGTMNVTMLTYPKNLEGSITVLGERGTVRIGGVALNRIDQWDFAETQPEDQEILKHSYQTESIYGNGHDRYYGNVLDALNGVPAEIVDGQEGLKSMVMLESIYRSARENATITCASL